MEFFLSPGKLLGMVVNRYFDQPLHSLAIKFLEQPKLPHTKEAIVALFMF